MQKYQLKIATDILPESLNKLLRRHRYRRHASNKRWDLIIGLMVQNKLPPAPLKKAKIKLTRHYYRSLDYDGVVGSLKSIVDALVTAGVLYDDSWGTLGAWEVDQRYRPKKDGPLIEIEITEL